MANPNPNDEFSVKNILFKRALPNITVQVAPGYKTFNCTDCGDKFLIQSSYDDHVNRKSLKITYRCQYCHLGDRNNRLIFYNRCNFLAHIRSHSFKTATIGISDLHVEPLPLSILENIITTSTLHLSASKQLSNQNSDELNGGKDINGKTISTEIICYECKKIINSTGNIKYDRSKHCMKYNNELHTCQICLFSLPTACALKAHLRIHTRTRPFYCPECGDDKLTPNCLFPIYNHKCDGFKMMLCTLRVHCGINSCSPFHPSIYNEHMKIHFKKVFKCNICDLSCLDFTALCRHYTASHPGKPQIDYFFKCQLCPDRLIVKDKLQNHLNKHTERWVYPCWTCGTVFGQVEQLLGHHNNNLCKNKSSVSNVADATMNETEINKKYRVVKKCESCKRCFVYKCKYIDIVNLPSICPYNCSVENKDFSVLSTEKDMGTNSNRLICHLCKINMSDNWVEVKRHYKLFHKEHQCLDIKIPLKRVNT